MTTLSDPILAGKTDPSTEFLKDYTISGGLQEVEDKVKELGWLGDSPVATVAIYFQDGEVNEAQIFTMGIKEVGRISAPILWGEHLRTHC